jgi:hypothetical protein
VYRVKYPEPDVALNGFGYLDTQKVAAQLAESIPGEMGGLMAIVCGRQAAERETADIVGERIGVLRNKMFVFDELTDVSMRELSVPHLLGKIATVLDAVEGVIIVAENQYLASYLARGVFGYVDDKLDLRHAEALIYRRGNPVGRKIERPESPINQ